MTCQTNFFFRIEMGPTIFDNWVMEIEWWELMNQTVPNIPYHLTFIFFFDEQHEEFY